MLTPLNYTRLALSSAYTAGSGTATVADASGLGSPSPGAAVIVTAFRASNPTVPLWNGRVEGVGGNTLTIAAITWGVDTSLQSGDLLVATCCAELLVELQGLIAANAAALVALDAELDSAVAAIGATITALDASAVHKTGTETIAGTKTFSSTITASITGNAGTVTNGVYTTGSYSDPSWIAALASTKITGTLPAAQVGAAGSSRQVQIHDGGVLGVATNFTLTTSGTLNIPGGDGTTTNPGLKFNNTTSFNPIIQWVAVGAQTGLRLYSNTTEIARFQDNGACMFSSLGTLGGLNLGNFFIQRGTGPRIDLGSTGTYSFDFTTSNSAFTGTARIKAGLASVSILTTEGIASQTGVHWRLRGRSSTTDGRDVGVIDGDWLDGTDATRKGRLTLSASDASADRPFLRGYSDGSNGRALVMAPASAPTDAHIGNLEATLFQDGGALYFRWKDSGGTATTTEVGGGGGGGSGTVTSVDLAVPSFLSVSGNPITTSGTITVALATQAAHKVFAGPTSGGAAAPTFRDLAAADVSDFNTAASTLAAGVVLAAIGSSVQAWDADLDAVAALSGTGFARRTGAATWSVAALAASDLPAEATRSLIALRWNLGAGTPISTGANKTARLTAPYAGTIKKCTIDAKTGPSGQALICDINVGGTSIWASTQANRIQLSAGSTTASQTSFDTTSVSAGDALTIDVDQVGSGTAGQDVMVELWILVDNPS